MKSLLIHCYCFFHNVSPLLHKEQGFHQRKRKYYQICGAFFVVHQVVHLNCPLDMLRKNKLIKLLSHDLVINRAVLEYLFIPKFSFNEIKQKNSAISKVNTLSLDLSNRVEH